MTKHAIIRGPTTRQFWTIAKRVPGIAHLLGYCHQCDASVDPGDHGCHACGVPFGAYLDRNFLGLPDVRPMPWELGAEDATAGGRIAAPLEPTGPSAGRISSFATDEELLGTAPTATAMAARPAPAPARGADGEPAPDGVSSPIVTALRRRIDRQRATIRTLWMLVAAASLVAVVSVGFAIRGGGAPDGPARPGPTETAASSPAGTQTDPSVPAPAPDTPDASAATDDDVIEPAAVGGAILPGAEAEPAVVTSAPGDRLVHALDLEERGDDERLPGADRIEAYEGSLAALETLLADRPDDAEITAAVDRLREKLERLRLREFFP
ncbi:MAG: hypothetical protein ACYTG1_11560 [Planctomycetota bacterium]